jgi:hypothetical protein
MALNPNAPLYTERDITLLNPNPDLANDFLSYPELDVDLLPGVPNQRGPQGPQGPAGISIVNLDGGTPTSIYGGITSINSGGVTQ